jgi:predicted murein hydrolase (TIGR00659 family)
MSGARLLEAAAWLAATLVAYASGVALHARARSHPVVNSVLVAAALLGVLLVATHTPYEDYAASTRPLSLLLGPATVALALPLYRSLPTHKSAVAPVVAGLVAGVVASSASAVLIGQALGATPVTVRSLAPKSVTTPIAMAVSTRIGGDASLTAVFVIVTGMIGAMVVPGLFRLVRIDDARARGLAIGVAAHGLGTARAVALGATELAFSVLGMGLSGVLTPILVPLAAPWLG